MSDVERAEKEPASSASRLLWGILAGAAIIAVCEPFYPTADPRANPGMYFWIVNLLVAYRFGLLGGFANAAVYLVYMAIGPRIPGSIFAHTPANEQRIWASAVIFGVSTSFVSLVFGKLRKETRRALSEAAKRRRAEEELQRSEALKRIVVDSSMDAIVLADPENRIVLWNHHAETLFGWTESEAKGRLLGDMLELPHSETGIAEIVASEGPTRIESVACGKNDRGFDVEMSLTHYEAAEGRMLVAFIRDISDRKRWENEIRELNAGLEQRVRERTSALEAKNEELEGFSFAISHDMRSPLRSIVANARMVLEDEGERVSESGRSYLERLASAALRMSLLVEDLLRYARLGNQAVVIERIDLTAIAEGVIPDVVSTYPEARIEVDPGLEAMGDARLMSLVFGNLFDNACKYVKPDVPPVVRFGQKYGEDGVFFVADNGIGIDMNEAERLFRPFERLHSESEYPGTGFGLANVRRCVERQGGAVWLESIPGSGTTFYIRLQAP